MKIVPKKVCACVVAMSLHMGGVIQANVYDTLAYAGYQEQMITDSEWDVIRQAAQGSVLTQAQRSALLDVCERIRAYAPHAVSNDTIETVSRDLREALEAKGREPRPDAPLLNQIGSSEPASVSGGAEGQDTQAIANAATGNSSVSNSGQSAGFNWATSGGTSRQNDDSNGYNFTSNNAMAVNDQESNSYNVALGGGSSVEAQQADAINLALGGSNIAVRGASNNRAQMFNVAVNGSSIERLSPGGNRNSINLASGGASVSNPPNGINIYPGSDRTRIFGNLDVTGSTNLVGGITASSLASTGSVTVSYDTDDSGGDAFIVQTGTGPTKVFEARDADVSVRNRPLNMQGNDIINIANLGGTSPIGVNDDLNMKSNSLTDVASIDGGGNAVIMNNDLDMNTLAIQNLANVNNGGSPISVNDDIDISGNRIESTNNILLNYNSDGSGTTDVFEVRQNTTPLLRASNTDVSVLNRNLNLNSSNSITNASDVAASSFTGGTFSGSSASLTSGLDMGGSNITNGGTVNASSFSGGSVSLSGNLDMGNNNINDVASIDGGGNAVIMNNNLDMNTLTIQNLTNVNNGGSPISVNDDVNMAASNINDVNSIDGGGDAVVFNNNISMANAHNITNANQIQSDNANLDLLASNNGVVFTSDGQMTLQFDNADGGDDLNIREGSGTSQAVRINHSGGPFEVVNRNLDMRNNSIVDVNSIDGGGNAVVLNDNIDIGSNKITSASGIALNYDTDDSNNDTFVVQTGSAASPLLRINNADVSIFDRSFEVGPDTGQHVNITTSGGSVTNSSDESVNLALSSSSVTSANNAASFNVAVDSGNINNDDAKGVHFAVSGEVTDNELDSSSIHQVVGANARVNVPSGGAAAAFNVATNDGDLDRGAGDPISDGINLDPGTTSIRFFGNVDARGNTIDNVTLTGISQITPASGGMTIALDPVQGQTLATQTTSSVTQNDDVLSLAFGADGFLYAGTQGATVFKFDPSDLSTAADSRTLSNAVTALDFGADGFLYVGTSGNAILQLKPSDLTTNNSDSVGSTVQEIDFGPDGFLYVLTSNDAFKFNPNDLATSVDSTSLTNGPESQAFGADGFLYIGTNAPSILKFDPSDLSTTIASNTSVSDTVLSLAFGADGFLYAGTQNTNSATTLLKLDPSDLSSSDSNSDTSVTNISAIMFGADSFLYAGDADEVLKFDPDDLSSTVGSESTGDTVNAFAFGSDGFLYAGTSDANNSDTLFKFDALDVGSQIAISNIAPAEDLQNYQLMLVANDGSRIRRSIDTADEFQNIITSWAYAKRNIGSVNYAAEQLMQVEPISFQYRGDKDDGHMHFGVRAEELAEYVPELVRYDAHGNPERVRYIEMVPLLLKTLQNHMQEHASLKDQLAYHDQLIHELLEDYQALYKNSVG